MDLCFAQPPQNASPYKATGAQQVMLTAKHHDGFVLYPSRYTDHDVEASPWWTNGPGGRNPDGDVLGAYVKAARKAGLKVGVYLSPGRRQPLGRCGRHPELRRQELVRADPRALPGCRGLPGRILPLAAPVTADGLRVRVLAARAAPRLLPPTVHLGAAGRR
ncbi:hypothetical protein GCM10010390_10300 [Streptomyces mordarskii]|uniref:alpha-L-fucosidase n=1 Tax=Streptomyces mordarskii TaxID=1226758 RepID=A0ABN1C0N9_9ACTN